MDEPVFSHPCLVRSKVSLGEEGGQGLLQTCLARLHTKITCLAQLPREMINVIKQRDAAKERKIEALARLAPELRAELPAPGERCAAGRSISEWCPLSLPPPHTHSIMLGASSIPTSLGLKEGGLLWLE